MTVRMRHTRGHTNNRRSHHALKTPRLTVNEETGIVHLRHRVCMETGVYRGKQVIDVASRDAKLEERREAKAKARGVDPESE